MFSCYYQPTLIEPDGRIADQEINKYLQKEQQYRPYLQTAVFTKGRNEYFPIPQHLIDLSVDPNGVQHLEQNPEIKYELV